MKNEKPNSGIASKPEEDLVVMTGKLDIDGKTTSVIIKKVTTANGKTLCEVYGQIGVAFRNDKKVVKQPDFQGRISSPLQWREVENEPFKRLSMWRQINKEGKPFFGIALSDPADFEKQDFKPKLEDKIEDGF